MKCLGPPESDWNMQSFQVTPEGCCGGRRPPDKATCEDGGGECVHFRDSTISRRHFEVLPIQHQLHYYTRVNMLCVLDVQISYDRLGDHYSIRDVGSAGGTFVRIPFGKKKELIEGGQMDMC